MVGVMSYETLNFVVFHDIFSMLTAVGYVHIEFIVCFS